ncbi:UNVERIFIED_CONTAM: hypothetical protein K2H54_060797 [Gekko kuhli]
MGKGDLMFVPWCLILPRRDSTDQWKVARVILTVSSHYPLSQILRMKDHDQCPATYQKDSPKSGMRIHIQQIMMDVLKAWM